MKTSAQTIRLTAAAAASPLQAEYGQTVDRESAYERLAAKLAPPADAFDEADAWLDRNRRRWQHALDALETEVARGRRTRNS